MVRRFVRLMAACLVLHCGWQVSGSAQPARAALTVDDLMRLRSIVDVQISPDGSRVAYVTSTPNLARNSHDAALFLVSADGGQSTRNGESVSIFNVPTPRPQLRWTPDGGPASVVAMAEGRPEVFAVAVSTGEARRSEERRVG